jgi:hypothetical protein
MLDGAYAQVLLDWLLTIEGTTSDPSKISENAGGHG